MKEVAEILAELAKIPGQPAVLATLVSIEGSSYRRPGARMLLISGENRVGTISGGCLEEDVSERARRVIRTGVTELAVYDTTNENDLIWGVGTGCKGIVRVLIEPIGAVRPTWIEALEENLRRRLSTNICVGFGADAGFLGTHLSDALTSAPKSDAFHEIIEPPPSLTIFGAGEDARPLSRMAKELGWLVSVFDPRHSLATTARFPEADAVIVAPCASLDEHVEIDERSYAVVMTHRFEDDLRLLHVILSRPVAYLGVVGSRSRTSRIMDQLMEDGASLNLDAVAALSAPVGLDIGATTPEEIALSILSEMQCVMTGRSAGRLRDRKCPIHVRVT